MRARLIIGAAMAAAVVAIVAPSTGQVPASDRTTGAPDIAPFVAKVIAPQVHLLTTGADYYGPVVGNVTLIEQSDGLVVIDSGLTAANGRAIVAYARSITNKPVKAVAITHWHNDHPQGVSAIRDAWPDVRIIATEATEAGMRGPESFNIGYSPNPKADEAMRGLLVQSKANLQKLLEDPATTPDRKERVGRAIVEYDRIAGDFAGTYIVLPTETFQRELRIDDRDVPVRLLHLGRANTDGDLLAWLPSQRILATGDIVVAPVPFGFGSFPTDWIETIGKIKAMGFTTLIPGHGEPMQDSSYLDKLVAAMSDIRSKVGPLAKQGVPVGEVRDRLDLERITSLFGTSQRNRVNFENLFIAPMIPNAYKEALGQPIIQGDGATIKPTFTETPPPSRAKRHQN